MTAPRIRVMGTQCGLELTLRIRVPVGASQELESLALGVALCTHLQSGPHMHMLKNRVPVHMHRKSEFTKMH